MLKNKGKRFLAAGLAAAMLLSASGCGTLAAAALNRAASSSAPEATAAPLFTPEPETTEPPVVEALPTAAPPDVPEIPVTPEPGTVEITEENYQTLFAPAPEYDWVGVAYMKAPENYGAFVDAYLPYGGSIAYRDEGHAVLGTAHGISVLERVFEAGASATAETSMEDLALYYQAMLEENGETLDVLGEVQYHAEYDIAVQQARAVSGDGQSEYNAILYSDTRGGGYYFQAIIFYLPEQFDGDTAALLEELGDVFGMVLPQG